MADDAALAGPTLPLQIGAPCGQIVRQAQVQRVDGGVPQVPVVSEHGLSRRHLARLRHLTRPQVLCHHLPDQLHAPFADPEPVQDRGGRLRTLLVVTQKPYPARRLDGLGRGLGDVVQ